MEKYGEEMDDEKDKDGWRRKGTHGEEEWEFDENASQEDLEGRKASIRKVLLMMMKKERFWRQSESFTI